MAVLADTPSIPQGRLGGQRFFRVGERDFYYVLDEPRAGYSGSRPEAWFKAVACAAENGEHFVEERTNKRLNDYVGMGVFGMGDPAWGPWRVGESVVVATYDLRGEA